MTTRGFTFQHQVPSRKKRDIFLAPFSAKNRDRLWMSRMAPEIRDALAQTVPTKDGRIAFLKNPKAACTTVAQLIYRHDHGHFFDGDIHRAPIGIHTPGGSWSDVLNALETGYAFSIVRHPESRAISGFFDFFVTRKNPEAAAHQPFAAAFGLDENVDLSTRFDRFLDYVSAALDKDALSTDRHFRPQALNLAQGHLRLDFIGKVETLLADLEAVSTATGLDITKEEAGTLRRNRSGSDAFGVTDTQRQRLALMFDQDYKLYGYESG